MEPFLCLAPLKGLTDAVFRSTFAEIFGGLDMAVAPFLPALKGARLKASQLKDVRPENNFRLPVVPQILGNDPDSFVSMAKVLYDLGHTTVNWNLGCPFPMVAKKRRGSGLLPFPDQVDAFLERAMRAIPNRLSIKMRLGHKHAGEILEILPILQRFPLEEVIIHPRTGVQMYAGQPDLDAFESCLNHTDLPIVYNGDITTRKDFQTLLARFPRVKGWMIGRGVLADPFLPRAIKGQWAGCADRVGRLRAFHDRLYDRYAQQYSGAAHLINKMKSYWFYFGRAFPEGRRILKLVHKAQQTDKYMSAVAQFFNECPQWPVAEI